jgi:hypothetical protein
MNSHRNRVNRWEFITTLCWAATTGYIFQDVENAVNEAILDFACISLPKPLDVRYLWYMLILILLNENTHDLHQ